MAQTKNQPNSVDRDDLKKRIQPASIDESGSAPQSDKGSVAEENEEISQENESLDSNPSIETKESLAPKSSSNARPIVKTLSDMNASSPGDCYAQLVEVERRLTKDGNPYYKTSFRDSKSSAQAILWRENRLFNECEQFWKVGRFYKIRGLVRNTNYGRQLDILRIREVTRDDKADGFDKNKCRPASSIPPESLAAEILGIVSRQAGKTPLTRLVQKIFKDRRLSLYETSASRFHHRVYVGGLLEHTLSVIKLAIFIADHYRASDPRLAKTINKPLIVVGAALHDIGKILDTQMTPAGPKRTIEGDLIGHAALGVRIARKYGEEVKVDEGILARLEHIILTHSRFPDWGAPFPPASLEAMIVHYADYVDSTFASSLKILDEDSSEDAFTGKKGPFGTQLLKLASIPLDKADESDATQTENAEKAQRVNDNKVSSKPTNE